MKFEFLAEQIYTHEDGFKVVCEYERNGVLNTFQGNVAKFTEALNQVKSFRAEFKNSLKENHENGHDSQEISQEGVSE